MVESTRVAEISDLAGAVALLREGRADVVAARGGRLWVEREAVSEPLEGHIGEAIADERWLVQLGFIDRVPLGITLVETEKVAAGVLAVIRELYVTPEARGVGLGALMLDSVLTWAGTRECSGLDGYALPGDRATKNFFESFGLVARGIVVHRSIT
ncbi:MAG: GNAT family N-acetyltransferase [Acidimicrobiales bacterium]